MPLSIAVLFYRIGPYHFARLRAAATALRVTAIEYASKDAIYAWDEVRGAEGFERVTLFPGGCLESQSRSEVAAGMGRVLGQVNPQVVAIPGWGDPASLSALQWCLRHGVPAVVMSETTAWDEPRRRHKEWVKGQIVAAFSAGLAGGQPHRDYLAQLGMALDRIFPGYDVVDNEYFAKKGEKVRGGNAETLKAETLKAEIPQAKAEMLKSEGQRLPGRYFLASARFVEKKNLPRLLQAYARYREKAETLKSEMLKGESIGESTGGKAETLKSEMLKGESIGGNTGGNTGGNAETLKADMLKAESTRGKAEMLKGESSGEGVAPISDLRPLTSDIWSLVLLGDGPLKADLCRLIADLSLQDCVLLPGFKQYPELPAYYGLASAFIHASTTEQWGLVVNEAMASGLPVLVSNRCGCAHDLVQEGVNGFTFDPCNVEQLSDLMLRISAFQPFSLSAFGDASRRIISEWGPERFASGLQQAVETALRVPRPGATLFGRFLLRALALR